MGGGRVAFKFVNMIFETFGNHSKYHVNPLGFMPNLSTRGVITRLKTRKRSRPDYNLPGLRAFATYTPPPLPRSRAPVLQTIEEQVLNKVSISNSISNDVGFRKLKDGRLDQHAHSVCGGYGVYERVGARPGLGWGRAPTLGRAPMASDMIHGPTPGDAKPLQIFYVHLFRRFPSTQILF
jgi:hypothetical protein